MSGYVNASPQSLSPRSSKRQLLTPSIATRTLITLCIKPDPPPLITAQRFHSDFAPLPSQPPVTPTFPWPGKCAECTLHFSFSPFQLFLPSTRYHFQARFPAFVARHKIDLQLPALHSLIQRVHQESLGRNFAMWGRHRR
jgi:hypothetical protein